MAVTREIVRLEVQGADQAERDLKGVAGALGGAKRAMGAIAVAAGAAAAAYASFSKALEVGAVGAKMRDLESAATRLGTTAGDIDALRTALAGTVTDADILRFSNMSRALGLTQEQFQKATEVAKASAAVLGIDTKFAVESVSVGLARQSKLWLDNLGIVLDTEGAYRKYAESLGTTAANLTDAQKRQAFFNEFVEAGNRLIASAPTERAADRFERLQAELGNVTDAATKLFSAIAGRGLKAIDDFSGATQRLEDRQDPLAARLRKAGEAATRAGADYRRAVLAVRAAGSVTRAEAQAILDRETGAFEASQRVLVSTAQESVDKVTKFYSDGAQSFAGAWVGAFEQVSTAAQRAFTPDNLPDFVQRFGVGVADDAEAARQRARARARGARRQTNAEFLESLGPVGGRGILDGEGDPIADRAAAEAARSAQLEQERFRLQAGAIEARIEARRREREAEEAVARSQQESALSSIAMLDANAAAWVRLAGSATSASQVVSGVAVPAVGQVTSALGQAAVSAIFAGESFTAALGTGIVQAGQQLMAQAISGLALAGIFSFIPWLAPFAGPLASASAVGLGVGAGLVGVGVGLGGEVRASLPGAAGGAGGGGQRVTGGDIEFERALRRGSGTGGADAARPPVFNVFLGGEQVDRGIHRAAARGARYDATRRALPA